ncbi:MAG: aminoacyl-tRNA hydrolase [Chloroflexota bacterium]
MSDKFLIVGLGNPGRQYAQTRHNAGFWVIDDLANRHNLTNFTTERKALTTSGRIKGQSVILAKPQTYMNLSGESVRALMDYYKVEIDNMIVIYDDIDLPFGTLRLRNTGGHGGQNGVRNIILHAGTKDFARVRFGIGRPPGKMKARDYVLQKFSGDDVIIAQQMIETASNAIEVWLEEGIGLAMSRFNGDVTENGTDGNINDEPSTKEQLQLAQRAHELNPNDPKPLRELTKLHKKMRNLDKAARAHLQLAEVYKQQGKIKQMLSEWEVAAKVRPALIELREELAITYEEQDNIKRAVHTWLKLADYHEAQGDLDNALASTEEAIRLNPEHPKATDYLAKFKNSVPE